METSEGVDRKGTQGVTLGNSVRMVTSASKTRSSRAVALNAFR